MPRSAGGGSRPSHGDVLAGKYFTWVPAPEPRAEGGPPPGGSARQGDRLRAARSSPAECVLDPDTVVTSGIRRRAADSSPKSGRIGRRRAPSPERGGGSIGAARFRAAGGTAKAQSTSAPPELNEKGWQEWLCGLEERAFLARGEARSALREECSRLLPCFLELNATRLTRTEFGHSEHEADLVSRARVLLQWSTEREDAPETPRFRQVLQTLPPDKKVGKDGALKVSTPRLYTISTPRSTSCSSDEESDGSARGISPSLG